MFRSSLYRNVTVSTKYIHNTILSCFNSSSPTVNLHHSTGLSSWWGRCGGGGDGIVCSPAKLADRYVWLPYLTKPNISYLINNYPFPPDGATGMLLTRSTPSIKRYEKVVIQGIRQPVFYYIHILLFSRVICLCCFV